MGLARARFRAAAAATGRAVFGAKAATAARAAFRAAAAAACASIAATLAAAQPANLDFETPAGDPPPPWQVSARGTDDGYDVARDAHAHGGARSLRVSAGTPAGSVRVEQRVDANALRARQTAAAAGGAHDAPDTLRVRLRGYVYAAPDATEDASLWLRVTGGGANLFVDSSGDERVASAPNRASSTALLSNPSEHERAAWNLAGVELPLPADAADIVIGLQVRNGATAWFDDLALELVDAALLAPAAPAAARYLDAALDIMQESSVRRSAVAWPALRAAAHGQARGARTPADTHSAIRYALRRLGDGHSYLSSPRWSARLRETTVSNARTGRAAAPPSGALVAGRFGYVTVPGVAGGAALQQVAFANRLQALIKTQDESGACGWMLNLRGNSGGNLWPMLVGAGPLLGEAELAAAVYPDGRRVAIWYDDGKGGFGDFVQLRVSNPPYALRDPAAPLAVLVDEATASSAEVLVAATRGRAGTRTFGRATSGTNSGNRNFALSDGATLVLAVALTSDRTGAVLRGPIEPDEPVAARRPTAAGASTAAPRGAAAQDPVVAAAAAWLAAQPACSMP